MISILDFDLSIHFAALQCLKHRLGRRGIRCLARLCTTLCGPLPLKRGVCINPGPEFPLGISSRSDSDREEIKVEIQEPSFSRIFRKSLISSRWAPLLKGKGPYNVVHRRARQRMPRLPILCFKHCEAAKWMERSKSSVLIMVRV